ncbi:MAG: DUF4926 domain-containing protein [Verrucomicrobiota bacterium]
MGRREIRELLDAVALCEPDEKRGLPKGSVGTVVEVLDEDHVEVEFSDNDGCIYAQFAVGKEALMVLHYEPAAA